MGYPDQFHYRSNVDQTMGMRHRAKRKRRADTAGQRKKKKKKRKTVGGIVQVTSREKRRGAPMDG